MFGLSLNYGKTIPPCDKVNDLSFETNHLSPLFHRINGFPNNFR